MKTGLVSFGRVCVIVALLWTLALSGHSTATAQARTDAAAPATAAGPSAALTFIENAGQFAEGARFQVPGRDLTLWLAEDAIWLTVLGPNATQSPSSSPRSPGETAGSGSTHASLPPSPGNGVNIKLSFPGANPQPRLEPFNRLETHVSFFTGSDPAQWRADVPAWGGVRYVDLYPGIDLELTGEQGGLAPRLVADPGADLSAVRLRVEGADTVAVEDDTLRLSSAGYPAYNLPLLRTEGSTAKAVVRPRGEMVFEVTSPFAPEKARSPGAKAPGDNPGHLLYGTFVGGNGSEEMSRITVDGSGAAYVTGWTNSTDLPATPGAFDPSYNGSYDAFVVKLSADGSTLEYATFLGGSSEDSGRSIAVDGSGAACVAGFTMSTDLPTTPGAFQPTYNGGYMDAFAAKLNAEGTALVYATYLGGSGSDYGYFIAVDSGGAAYVTGETASSNFPTTPGAFDTTYNTDDAFVAKLNTTGSALDYGTFFGGSGGEEGRGIAVDGSGAAYVTGVTTSSDLPTTPSAFDTTYNGYEDAFVAKLNAAGSDLAYSTFLGADGYEQGRSIAFDASGAAYVTGWTDSSNFPTTPGAFDRSLGGSMDAFVARLSTAGSTLTYATFLGGDDGEDGYGIAVDRSGAAYVTGGTSSPSFPTTPDAFDRTHNGSSDGFVARLNAAGAALTYATFLGGSATDIGYGIALGRDGAAYVTGLTWSSDLPTTPGAFDTSLGGDIDCFAAKLKVPIPNLDYGTFLGGSDLDYGEAIAVDGNGAAYVTGWTRSSDLPTTPGAFDTGLDGTDDAFVVKLNAAGSALEYATFLGGSDVDGGSAIAVDGSGAAYVSGNTWSSDLPTTPGAFDTTYNGGWGDVFMVKLNATGSALEYATYLGGSDRDWYGGMGVDGSGAAYVTGETGSSDLPTTPGAFDTTLGGDMDAFVVKLNAAGSALDYGTFLGGSSDDRGFGMAVDGNGAAYVTGEAGSSDLPTTPGAFDTTFNGGYADAFVAKLNAAGSALDYATFLGGSSTEWGSAIAVDGSGAAYVMGVTGSSDLPTTPGAFDTTYNGGISDAFAVKLNAAGSALDYATFLGGSSEETGRGIAVDGSGAAYVTGRTSSPNSPTTCGALDRSYNGGTFDAIVAKLNVSGSALDYATFLGGSGDDEGGGIVVDGSGAAYVTGYTASSDLPTTPGAFDTTSNGGGDGFVAKMMMEPTVCSYVYLPVVFQTY